jgi:hypothetical protein
VTHKPGSDLGGDNISRGSNTGNVFRKIHTKSKERNNKVREW